MSYFLKDQFIEDYNKDRKPEDKINDSILAGKMEITTVTLGTWVKPKDGKLTMKFTQAGDLANMMGIHILNFQRKYIRKSPTEEVPSSETGDK